MHKKSQRTYRGDMLRQERRCSQKHGPNHTLVAARGLIVIVACERLCYMYAHAA